VSFITRYARTLSHERAVAPYLRLMAARQATKEKRRMARPRYEDMDRYISQAGIDAERRATCQVLLPRLETCLGELTPKAQRAIKLRFYAEMTNERIAAVLGCSKQYIGRLLQKSLTALRRCMDRVSIRRAQAAAGGSSP
jgi:RNA polymerase sigma factor (sigma-70 family)